MTSAQCSPGKTSSDSPSPSWDTPESLPPFKSLSMFWSISQQASAKLSFNSQPDVLVCHQVGKIPWTTLWKTDPLTTPSKFTCTTWSTFYRWFGKPFTSANNSSKDWRRGRILPFSQYVCPLFEATRLFHWASHERAIAHRHEGERISSQLELQHILSTVKKYE